MAHDHGRQYSIFHPAQTMDRQPLLLKKTFSNQDLALHEPNSMSNLLSAQDKASRKRVVKETGWIVAGIVVCTIGIIIAYPSYICVFHQCQVSGSSVISSAPLGPVLTVSQITSHVAPLLVPFTMDILSKLTSARWLKASAEGGSNRPSPKQLGLLMSMFDGAGLFSVFSTIQYTFKGAKSGHEMVQPPLFRQCLFFLASILAITYSMGVAVLWLHVTSTNVSVWYTSAYSSLNLPNLGREFNTTLCPTAGGVCDNGGSSEGARVMFNTSTVNRVVFSDDQTAIVVPENIPPNVRYSAKTFGVKSQCRSVTRECLAPLVAQDGSISYGNLDFLNLNCTQGGVNFADGLMDSNGLCLLSSNGSTINSGDGNIETNPFNTGDIMATAVFLDPAVNNTDKFINNTGWFAHGMYGAYNAVYCNVTALSVTYIYESPRFITVSHRLQPLDIAGHMMSSGNQVGLVFASSVSSGAVSQASADALPHFEDIYALELSRQLLAGGAYLYKSGPVLEIQNRENVNGSKLQLDPLVIFVVTLVIFLSQVLYIGTRTIIAISGIPYVGLAARHLSSPIISIQRLYGHPSPELTWEMDSDKGFGTETESDRLRIGPVLLPDRNVPGSVFMVEKAHGHQRSGLRPLVSDYQPLLSSKTNDRPSGNLHSSEDATLNLQEAQERASQDRVGRKTGLIASGICLCIIAMIFALLSYICIFHQCQVSNGWVISTARLGRILTISQAASQLAPLSVPFIMETLSNLASARWLRSSADGGPNRPSPMQLGLLMSMFNGAGLAAFFSSIWYIFNGPKGGQKIDRPPIFRQCVVFLGSLLATAYLAAAADAWLHASSTNVDILTYSPYTSGKPTDFARGINPARCAQLTPGADPVKTMTCGFYDDVFWANGPDRTDDGSYALSLLAEGTRVVFNTSTMHHVVFSDDQTALVVPQNLPGNISYSAETLGVKSQCISLTESCLTPTIFSNGSKPDFGPDGGLEFNCSNIGFSTHVNGFGGLYILRKLFAVQNPGYPLETNPFSSADLVKTSVYLQGGDISDQFINNTGWFVHGTATAYNIVNCNITALSVNYTFESSRFITKSYTPLPLEIARYMMSGGVQVASKSLGLDAVSLTGIDSISMFENNYAMELSRQLAGGSAYIFETRPVSQIQSEITVDASKLRLIPLVLFVCILLIFIFQVLYIATRTMIATWGVKYVALAAQHLSNPIIAIQRLYGHYNPELTWEMDTDKWFGPETESDRLNIGPVLLKDDGSPGSVFMVAKGGSNSPIRDQLTPGKKSYDNQDFMKFD